LENTSKSLWKIIKKESGKMNNNLTVIIT